MGFITINGQSVHTSSISLSGTCTASSTITTPPLGTTTYITSPGYITPTKSTYHLMGEDIEVYGFHDFNTSITISLISTIGWKYYEELKKNNVTFSTELGDILEQRYKVYVREQKINSILETKQ